MESKNYTQVLIDGKIYTLGGSEDEGYLQKAASYVNEKKAQMRRIPGYTKQNADYQTVMMELNIADDYFKAMDRFLGMERQKNQLEKETYSLKHELVSTQMKLEAVLKDLEERQRELDMLTGRHRELEEELEEARRRLKAGEHREAPSPASSPAQPEAQEETAQAPDRPESQGAEEEEETYPIEGANLQEAAVTAEGESAAATDHTAVSSGATEEELAQKALQAARKARGRKGGRR